MTIQPNGFQFWRRWFLMGLLSGMLAGLILMVGIPIVLYLRQSSFAIASSKLVLYLLLTVLSLMALGGLYGLGQGLAQYFSLNPYIPRMGRSLRANFIGTAVGVVVTGSLLIVLLVSGFGSFLESLGLSFGLRLIIQVFIVGGFGGIAQAIVARSILGQTTDAGYFRWIVPLALLGHVSGGLVGIVASLFISPLFA
ncbi:hypothetical protein C7B76_29485 [filamentous cyanobacterium CCP2]|nr:hypothetical protein C7B76_29485 [filamentous cyanobacterium CCP2]